MFIRIYCSSSCSVDSTVKLCLIEHEKQRCFAFVLTNQFHGIYPRFMLVSISSALADLPCGDVKKTPSKTLSRRQQFAQGHISCYLKGNLKVFPPPHQNVCKSAHRLRLRPRNVSQECENGYPIRNGRFSDQVNNDGRIYQSEVLCGRTGG